MLLEEMITKMSAKRILLLILTALCLLGAGAAAYADEPLGAVCAFAPADFTEPGTALLSVTVHNTSDKLIENMRITQDANKEGEKIGSVEPGETVHFSCSVQITKKMLDAGKVNLLITYKTGNKNHKMQVSAKVTRVENIASASLTSRIYKTALYAGESTQAEYRLVNTGAIAIENAIVTDPAFHFTSSAVTLAPGEEKVFYASYAFFESAISSPRADFVSSESRNPYVVHATSAAIHAVDDNLAFTVEPDSVSVNYGGRAHFSVTIKNNGLLSYTDLTVTAENLGAFPAAGVRLNPGASASIQLETPPVTFSGTYPIVVSMREAGGSERSFPAGEMNVSVQESVQRNPLIYVTADAAGISPFTITVSGANRDLKNVVLSEKSLGDIKTFLVIKADSETVFSPKLYVDKGEAFEFMLTWSEDGETFSVSATPVISQFTTAKDAGEDLTEAAHASLYTMVNATHLPRVILIACLTLLFLALAFFILYRSVQAKKRRLQVREQLGKTSKFAPIRTKDTEKENP